MEILKLPLKPNLHPQLVSDSVKVLNEMINRIGEIGEYTQVDHKTNSRYANLIIDLNTLIKELKNVNSN
jgi:hypothetical protein